MKMVTVDGCKYPLVESLGFNHDVGGRAWIVKTKDGEKTAVGPIMRARFWTPTDRVRPLREYLERKAREELLAAAQPAPDAPGSRSCDGTKDATTKEER
jgi:hypothetical protein